MSGHGDILYSAGLTIADDALVATLATCFERVYLPHLLFSDIHSGLARFDAFAPAFDALKAWNDKWKMLFEEGVFQRLPRPGDEVRVPLDDYFEFTKAGTSKAESILQSRKMTPLEGMDLIGSSDVFCAAARPDIDLPRLFNQWQGTNRFDFVALEAHFAFRYFLPLLSTMEAEPILELRKRVASTREGFGMHLQRLSKDINAMIDSGEPLTDLKRQALTVVETELIPDYKEFKRQIDALNAGRLRKFLDASGRIAEIDAAPWTPKFWAMLVRALGFTLLATAEERREQLSNRSQAFEFLRLVEEESWSKP